MVPMAVADLLGATGCSPAVTVDGTVSERLSTDAGGGVPDASTTTHDSSVAKCDGCAGSGAPSEGMTVGGVTCTGVTASVETQSAPDGKTWILEARGMCGAYGTVEIFMPGKDDRAYPFSCGAGANVQLSVGADDGGFGYDSFDGSCTVYTGPSSANQTTGVRVAGVVSKNGGSSTLSFSYAP